MCKNWRAEYCPILGEGRGEETREIQITERSEGKGKKERVTGTDRRLRDDQLSNVAQLASCLKRAK